MDKKYCKFAAVICLCAMLLVPCQAVFAANDNNEYEVSPMMTYIADYTITYVIVGTTAEVKCTVNGDYLTATKAKVIAELQLKSGDDWLPVAIWTDTQEGHDARVDETKTVTKGNTYRVKATFTIWEGNASESVTSYSDEITA